MTNVNLSLPQFPGRVLQFKWYVVIVIQFDIVESNAIRHKLGERMSKRGRESDILENWVEQWKHDKDLLENRIRKRWCTMVREEIRTTTKGTTQYLQRLVTEIRFILRKLKENPRNKEKCKGVKKMKRRKTRRWNELMKKCTKNTGRQSDVQIKDDSSIKEKTAQDKSPTWRQS